MSDFKQCLVLRRGLTAYPEGWEMQRQAVAAVGEGRSPHVLILLQHPPTYTLGVRGKAEHLLASKDMLARLGARVYRVDRGGDVTFHGPGQVVGYPILRLDAWGEGPLWYVRQLEAALIDALAALGITAGRVQGRPGVWVDGAKVAAIGVRISRGVTSHGFALNVNTDLSYFRHIVPCGLAEAAVTSVARLLGQSVPLWEVEDLIIDSLGRVFGLEMVERKRRPRPPPEDCCESTTVLDLRSFDPSAVLRAGKLRMPSALPFPSQSIQHQHPEPVEGRAAFSSPVAPVDNRHGRF